MLAFIKRSYLVLVSILLCAVVQVDPFDDSFYPYRDGPLSYPGLTPGMTIDQSNVEQFKEVLDPATYQYVKKGYAKIPVGKTIPFPLRTSETPGRTCALSGELSLSVV